MRNKIIKYALGISLISLALISCKTPVDPEPTANEILEKAKTMLVLPEIKETDNSSVTMALPEIIDADGKTVKVTWTAATTDKHCILKDNLLVIQRDLEELTYKLKGTLTYNGEKLEKEIQLKIPSYTKFDLSVPNYGKFEIEFTPTEFIISKDTIKNNFPCTKDINKKLIIITMTNGESSTDLLFKYEIVNNSIILIAAFNKNEWYYSLGEFYTADGSIVLNPNGPESGDLSYNGIEKEITPILPNTTIKDSFKSTDIKTQKETLWHVKSNENSITIIKLKEDKTESTEKAELEFHGENLITFLNIFLPTSTKN